MYSDIFSIVAPVFITVSIGFFWNRSGREYDTELITSLVTYFATPCLIFSSLSSVELSPHYLLIMAMSALAANLFFIVVGSVFLFILRLSLRSYLQVLSFPNIGNIGLPICLLAFGDDGLALAVTFFAVYAAFQLTIGAAFVSGSFSPKTFLTMPIIPATLLALLFLFSDLPIPAWLYNTTKLIGDLTIPLMLITLGVSLSKLKIDKMKIPILLSTARLFFGFTVGLLVTKIFQLEGKTAGVVILQCSMPAAVFCYLFSQMYKREPEDVAGTVVLSTILSFLLLPAILFYVLNFTLP